MAGKTFWTAVDVNKRFERTDAFNMFVSEGTYYGDRYNLNCATPEGEEPFGSVNDFIQEQTNGKDEIVAGGPFWDPIHQEAHNLIINPVDENGVITWLTLPYNVFNGDQRRNAGHVIPDVFQRAIDNLWIVGDNLGLVIFVQAGKSSEGLGTTRYSSFDDATYGSVPNVLAGEKQGFHGHSDVNQTEKMTNIGVFCHEILHHLGLGHPGDCGYFDVMQFGDWCAPRGDEQHPSFGRGISPAHTNPYYMDLNNWCNMVTINEDIMGLELTYSTTNPTFYEFAYDASHGTSQDGQYHGKFFLENRCLADEADQDHDLDFNSFSVGSYEWPGHTLSGFPDPDESWPLVSTDYRNNLLIWHKEGYIENTWGYSPRAGGGLYRFQALYLERSCSDWSSMDVLNGDCPFPGDLNRQEFGPGTGAIDTCDVGNILFGSSHDLWGEDNDSYRADQPLQTGFCVKNIVADDVNDRITCDVYTNYWGGDVTENLTLYTLNEDNRDVYLGQDCVIKEGKTVLIRPSEPTEDCHIYIDSDIWIEDGAVLRFMMPRVSNGIGARLYVHGNNHWIHVMPGGTLRTSVWDGNNEVSGRMRFVDGGGIIMELGVFDIEAGIATMFSGTGSGTALSATSSDIDLSEVTFTDYDYAITLDDCEGEISNCVFEDCNEIAVKLLNYTDDLIIDDCEFTGMGSAAIYLNNSDPDIENCLIYENDCGGSYGSAIYAYNSSPHLRDNNIYDNEHVAFKSMGGGYPVLTTYTTTDPHRNRFANNNTYSHIARADSSWSEIVVASPSYLCINKGHNDVINTKDGVGDFLISRYNNGSSYLSAMYNYWDTPIPLGSDDFYPTGSVDYSSYDGTPNYTASENDEIDAEEMFALAFQQADSGLYAEANEGLRSLVAEYPATSAALAALSMIKDLGPKIDLSPATMQRYFAGLAESDGDFGIYADRLAILCQVDVGEYLEAIQEYTDGMADVDNHTDSLYYAIDRMYAMIALLRSQDGGNLDGADVYSASMEDIEKQVERLMADLNGRPLPGDKAEAVPEEFGITACHPNPFNNITNISYRLTVGNQVKALVYDMNGREVARLFDGYQDAGTYDLTWNAAGVGSGVYIVRMEALGMVDSRKVILCK